MFELRRGDSLDLAGKVTYKTGEPPAEAPLPVGTTAAVTVRRYSKDGSKLEGWSHSPALEWKDAMGAYTISVDEAETINWKEGSYIIEVELTFPSADDKVLTFPWLEFTVTPRAKAIPVTP